MTPGALGAAQQRAEVPRIGDAGRHQQEGLGPAGSGRTRSSSGTGSTGRARARTPLGRLGAGLGVETGARARSRPECAAGRPAPRSGRAGARGPGPRPAGSGARCAGRPRAAPARPGGLRPGRRRARSARAAGRAAGPGCPVARPAPAPRSRPGHRRGRGRSAPRRAGRRGGGHAPPAARWPGRRCPRPGQRAQALGPGGLDRDGRAQHAAESRRHGGGVRRQARGVGHHGAVGVDTDVTLLAGHAHHLGEQVHAVRPRPDRVGVGEVAAEVAQADGTEHGVGQGVAHRVGVAVARPARGRPRSRTPPSTRRTVGVLGEGVDVDALSDAHAHPPRSGESSAVPAGRPGW